MSSSSRTKKRGGDGKGENIVKQTITKAFASYVKRADTASGSRKSGNVSSGPNKKITSRARLELFFEHFYDWL